MENSKWKLLSFDFAVHKTVYRGNKKQEDQGTNSKGCACPRAPYPYRR